VLLHAHYCIHHRHDSVLNIQRKNAIIPTETDMATWLNYHFIGGSFMLKYPKTCWYFAQKLVPIMQKSCDKLTKNNWCHRWL